MNRATFSAPKTSRTVLLRIHDHPDLDRSSYTEEVQLDVQYSENPNPERSLSPLKQVVDEKTNITVLPLGLAGFGRTRENNDDGNGTTARLASSPLL